MPREIAIQLACFGALAVISGAIAWSARFFRTGPAHSILPPQRRRAVPWHFGHVGIVLVLCIGGEFVVEYLANPRVARDALAAEVASKLASGAGGGLAAPLDALATGWSAYQHFLPEQVRQELWALTALRVLQSIIILGVIGLIAGGRPYQLGLTCHRWEADLALGYMTWLVLTPLVFLVFFAATLIWQAPAEQHPVEVLLRGQPGVESWVLGLVTTLAVAPVAEELLVRGLVQQWMMATPRTADIVLLSALFFAISWGISAEAPRGTSPALGAILFLVTVGPGYLLFERLMARWLPEPGAARAIYASSLLFAAMHNAWPSQIPLFVLSLGLGYVAYRTQSLIAPIVLHMLFNAVSTLPLVLSQILAN